MFLSGKTSPVRRFDERGSAAAVFALALLPLAALLSSALDYGRAISTAAIMQAALDQAVFSAAAQAPENRAAKAEAILKSTLTRSNWTLGAPEFKTNEDGSFTGTVTISMPMSLASIIFPAVDITRSATASPDAGPIASSSHSRGTRRPEPPVFVSGARIAR